MKICFITEYFPTSASCDIRGGAEVVAYYEAKYMASTHDVHVITSFEPGTQRTDVFNNIKVFRCGKVRDYVQKNAFMDRMLFMKSAFDFGKTQKYDLIIGVSIISYVVAWRLSKKLEIPCIIRYHDVLVGRWIKNFGPTGIIGELFERYVLSRKYAAIIAVSNYTEANLRKFCKYKDNIHVVHNGVEVPEIEALKPDYPTISCVSRLVKYKRIDDLVEAVALIAKEIPHIQCNIVGTGPEETSLKQLCRQRGIENQVHFLGFVNDHLDVLKIIKSSHVFCLPSSLEGFGIVVIESMACGVPFVASNIPPIIEASDRKGGLFFECRDVLDLAEKIKQVFNDKQLQIKLIEEGRRRASELTWEQITKRSEAIYTEVYDQWLLPKKEH